MKNIVPYKRYSLGTFSLALVSICVAMNGCSSTSESEAFARANMQSNNANPHTIAIVNASSEVINAIKYKPCKSRGNSYQYLTGNLRPAEKFTINIYSQCVDLLATNAFKKKLVDVKNVDLKTIKTWTIK